MTKPDDNDVKDQELQIKIQENERLQREVCRLKIFFQRYTSSILQTLQSSITAKALGIIKLIRPQLFKKQLTLFSG